MKECALFYLDRIDMINGKAVINASTSPEQGEGGYEAWGTNPTMDIALIKELLGGAVEASKILDCDRELAQEWRDLLERMPGYPVKDGYLIEMQGREFRDSHRHGSVLAPIYPCAELTSIGGPSRRRLGRASLERFVNKGRWSWEGYTYPWIALVAARLGQGDRAAELLKEFIGVGCLRCGGLHLNDDFSGSMKAATGKKNFTLEGNTMYSAAVLEMLLQSHGDVIQVFPAVPKKWKDVSFTNLRARGAFLISSWRKDGKTEKTTIRSLAGGPCRMLTPFGKSPIVVRKTSANTNTEVCTVSRGKLITFATSKNTEYSLSRR